MSLLRCTLLTLLPALMVVGCDEPDGLSSVSGIVTVDGQPAAQGAISLIPLGSDARRSGGAIEAGSYSMKAPQGRAKVVIHVPKVVGQQPSNDPNQPARPIMKESLPPRFNSNSELVIEVQPGESVHNFDLTSS
ncbi:hypothetical protein Pla123a_30350 [Posidoniimonas polymericola]|uniref:Carboxypeptidase regulatory-like domain-containing protein n=1 Tax=Posidoniimonas polymericola TaxID=2528002 RepID=A0A5C5YKS9_9BACT|nr:hypothetical protein [Posidoniimonas polymericola]TWT75525.1 hypothetical protein Pla123a_30350 [Posidoniimonas polymericola]